MGVFENRFLQWCFGFAILVRHPISRPIELGKSIEILVTRKEPYEKSPSFVVHHRVIDR